MRVFGLSRNPFLRRMSMPALRLATLWLLAAALCMAGCARVGPDYVRPAAKLPKTWKAAADPAVVPGKAEIRRWWAVFHDPVLTELVQAAAAGNLDLKTAVARVKEARARVGVVTGGVYPQVAAEADLAAQRGSKNAVAGIGATANRYALGVNSSWEIDLFGRISRSVQAASADYQASREDRTDVLVSLYAEVARDYLAVRTLQARLAATEGNIASQKQVLELTRARYRYGLASDLDVAQAEDVLAGSEAQVPPLRLSLTQTINTIGVLLGELPGALQDQLRKVRPIPLPPPPIAVGVPADLLRQRPDIRRAERQLAAQTARIGVATADLYPSFTLLGTIGLEATNPGDLFSSASHFYTIGPTIRWNLFAGGSIRSRIKVEDALTEQALLHYEQTVLRALEEAENALTAYLEECNRMAALQRSVAAARRTRRLAIHLYKAGLKDFQNVLDAERNVFIVENQLAESRGRIATNLVGLYKALGGGWDPDDTRVSRF